MVRAGTVAEVEALRAAQATRTPWTGTTPDPALLAWRILDRGGRRAGAYGYLVVPGLAVYVVELLVDGTFGARACVELNADMSALAKKEGLGLVTTVPVENVPMIDICERAGWKKTVVTLERSA